MEDILKRLEERKSELKIKNKLIKDKTAEIAKLKQELEKGKHVTDVKTVQQYESKFKALQERVQDKDSRIKQLETSLKQANDLIGEYKTYKEKYETLQEEHDQQSSKLQELEDIKTDLEKQNHDLKYKVEGLEERLEREISALKGVHKKKEDELKKVQEGKLESIKRKLAPSEIMLKYAGAQFVRVMSRPASGIILILDEANQKWKLDFNNEPNLIERKTAERQARSIAKSGYLSGGNRVGVGLDLEIVSGEDVPEALLRDQHEFNE